ncbi:MAG: hypothetical protein F8N37_12170 [Telmatospirillum sp.]|nr:hypothetical protein [Telmatospirillum sp.]
MGEVVQLNTNTVYRPDAVANGGGGGHDGGMDDVLRRVSAVEGDMKEVKAVLGRMEPLLIRMDERLRDMPTAKEFGELKGRVAQLPTTIQLIGFVIAVLVASGLLKYLVM